MSMVLHGSGAGGLALYEYERGDLMLRAERATSRSGWTEAWYHALLPDQVFASSCAALTAALALSPEAIAAERARYPLIRKSWPDTCANRCRLCGPSGVRAPGHTRVAVAVNWRPVRDWTASLCSTHWEQFKDNPRGLLAALRARVQHRSVTA